MARRITRALWLTLAVSFSVFAAFVFAFAAVAIVHDRITPLNVLLSLCFAVLALLMPFVATDAVRNR
jgi:hypothetical protein